jgi:hypothetical protein
MTINSDNAPLTAQPASASAVSWSAIIAGAVAAAAASVVLLALGSGLGLAASAPSAHAPSPATFGVMTAVWLILTQWVASGLGGYLSGRLRTRWIGTHVHEVFFRDTAHGFLTWALAAVATAVLIGPALAGAADAGAPAASVDPDAARKAASALSIFTALSMMVGAFIASVAAAIGGHERDLHP